MALHEGFDFAADLYLFPREEGGLISGISGYPDVRAQLRYAPGYGNTYTATFYPIDDVVIAGETKEVYVNIIAPHLHIDSLAVGTPFSVEVAGRVTATGKITRLLNLLDNAKRYREYYEGNA